MSDDRTPRVDTVSGTYERVGKCEGCGKKLSRSKTFKGASLEDCQLQARIWGKLPFRHKGCEQ